MSNLLKYDVIYILDPNATAEEMAAVSAKVEQVTADAKGTVLKKDEWGRRRLAYLVKKHREGFYVFFHLSIPPDAVAEINRNLRLLEKVIKFSIVKDDISHLKAKVKPARVKTSTDGASSRPGSHGHRPSSHASGPVRSPSTGSSPAPASGTAAPASAPSPAPQATPAPSPAPTNP
jgi:small subunit ribosomal protein S6